MMLVLQKMTLLFSNSCICFRVCCSYIFKSFLVCGRIHFRSSLPTSRFRHFPSPRLRLLHRLSRRTGPKTTITTAWTTLSGSWTGTCATGTSAGGAGAEHRSSRSPCATPPGATWHFALRRECLGLNSARAFPDRGDHDGFCT